MNGEKHGRGIEYDFSDKIEFQGEYLNGLKRKGKSYIDGKFEFKGEYLLNKKWNGKGFDKYGYVLLCNI